MKLLQITDRGLLESQRAKVLCRNRMVLANIFDFHVMSKSLGSNRPCLINVPSWAKKMIPREKLYAGQRACRCRENCTPVVFKLMLEENWCHALSTHLGEPLHDCWETGKSRACHELPSLVNLSQHMLNRVGKEEFEKLSDVPEWSVFDLSDALFDKFLLFFKLEAEMRPEERKERREKGLGKATALAERGGKAGEGDKMKTLEEVKELQSDLEASFAEEAEVKCNAEQVVEKFSFPLFQSLKI